ncbi:MAG: phosphogluconate dehydratase [Sphingomonadales bacterium]|nr:phosphogluconate dehydratase [Sphingomonadales bacterium]
MHETVLEVTERIRAKSRESRTGYLQRMAEARRQGPHRGDLSCGNLAHGFAAAPAQDKLLLRQGRRANIGIVTSYNDMLSAHQPFETFPAVIKEAARKAGATAQVAGGVPAMCDGVTQGQEGMELSLFSRDTIALGTAVALSHNMFDAALCLGICDKIVPGLLIGALSFGHLPVIFVPGGPMPSGLPNSEKAKVRGLYAQGKVGREELLDAEAESYHSPGTCTFYGTANSNQMLMEVMGLHLPGAAFVNPGTPLRDALTAAAAVRAATIVDGGNDYRPLAEAVDEKAVVNGIVGLLATGGSTNHTIHLIAIAQAAGIAIDWDDFSELSAVVPLLARIYPNGLADVNHFHAAGGMGFLIRELLDAGLLHEDISTVNGTGLAAYAQEPVLANDELGWQDAPEKSLDPDILRPVADPFQADGGLKVLTGNIGRSIIKTSAVKPEHRKVTAPARVFENQWDLEAAFKAGDLERDVVAVIRFQGPRANGMPELHRLTPILGVLQDKGFKVALVTDGRMSGASGKVPAAIHVVPETAEGGALAKIVDGDVIALDGEAGTLELQVPDGELAARRPAEADLGGNEYGMGRELFALMRRHTSTAELGASAFLPVRPE